MDAESLTKVAMPNRNRFILDDRPEHQGQAVHEELPEGAEPKRVKKR